MPTANEQFRRAHAALRALSPTLRAAARDIPRLSPVERATRRDSILSSLSRIETHMRLDENVMYAAVAERLRDPLATAPMRYDHLAIRDWLRQLRDAPLDDPDLLQELLYGLDALIRVHLWKEDALYLRMLESPLWPAA
jgi:Hemerythrin HHE cation binding domain